MLQKLSRTRFQQEVDTLHAHVQQIAMGPQTEYVLEDGKSDRHACSGAFAPKLCLSLGLLLLQGPFFGRRDLSGAIAARFHDRRRETTRRNGLNYYVFYIIQFLLDSKGTSAWRGMTKCSLDFKKTHGTKESWYCVSGQTCCRHGT